MIILLIVIYLAFISLGLPDSILGTALPGLLGEYSLPLSAGSLLSTVIMSSTVISSFLCVHVIKRLGTGLSVFISCLMTGGAMLGFSFSHSFYWLIALGVPLGLGGGTVDAALNNFVARHYKAHHMNWLHSFWGVGATLGPVIMSISLASTNSWRSGYSSISIIQLGLGIILLLSLPLWSKVHKNSQSQNRNEETSSSNKKESPFKIKGVFYALFIMMLYCTIEASIGLWGSSFLLGARNFTVENSASFIAFYFGGITAGRFLSGFMAFKFNNNQLIRLGLIIVITGIIGLIFFDNPVSTGIFIVVTGFGLAPIFPSMIHETPRRFGETHSQALIGYQMGFAYIGTAFLSPAIGVILQIWDVLYFPYILLFLAIILSVLSEILNRKKLNAPVNNRTIGIG
ncbi:MAG: MFS transporter [Spirochaetales bacterium]|nr:MFS transporter [Spirochaetales bacterium]